MAYLRLGESVFLAPAEAGLLVYDIRSGRLQQLNALASLLVELCDGTRDARAIRELLTPLLGVEALPACDEWIESALRSSLIESAPEGDAASTAMSAEELARVANRLQADGDVLQAFICQYNACELAPEVAEGWYRLGDLAQRAGRRDEARQAFDRYFELRPGDVEIEHILNALRDGTPPARASDRYIESLFDRFAPTYDADMCGTLQYQAPAQVADALMPLLGDRRDLHVLDLGCGTGLSGEPLRRSAATLTGVDLSTGMIEKARERSVYDMLRVAEITAFLASGEGAPYDVIASCDTFIYFGDLRQVVPPSARLLAADGVLAFSAERGDRYPFYLTDSGRYAHHRQHVTDVAVEAGLELVSVSEPVLRYEFGAPVRGIVAVMRRAGA